MKIPLVYAVSILSWFGLCHFYIKSRHKLNYEDIKTEQGRLENWAGLTYVEQVWVKHCDCCDSMVLG